MPSTDRKLELKAKTSLAQTTSQAAVYAKGLISEKIHQLVPEFKRNTHTHTAESAAYLTQRLYCMLGCSGFKS
jgi:hypothetical protein